MSKFSLSLLLVAASFLFMNELYADCNFQTVTDVAFGSYDVLSGSANDSTGGVSITCDDNRTVWTSIGPSPNSGGFTPRKMINATSGDLLNYNLYTTSARTAIWGDGTQGTERVQTVINNTTKELLIYGRVPPGQDVSVGEYGELLVIMIDF